MRGREGGEGGEGGVFTHSKDLEGWRCKEGVDI